jgi:hypothetical protein
MGGGNHGSSRRQESTNFPAPMGHHQSSASSGAYGPLAPRSNALAGPQNYSEQTDHGGAGLRGSSPGRVQYPIRDEKILSEANEMWPDHNLEKRKSEKMLKIASGVGINERFDEKGKFSTALDMYEKADLSLRGSLLKGIEKNHDVTLLMKLTPAQDETLTGEAFGFIGGYSTQSKPEKVAEAIKEGHSLNLTTLVNSNSIHGEGSIAEALNHENSLHHKADMKVFAEAKEMFSNGQSLKQVAHHIAAEQCFGAIGELRHLPLARTLRKAPNSDTRLMMDVKHKMLDNLPEKSRAHKEMEWYGKFEKEHAENEVIGIADQLKGARHVLSDFEAAKLEAIQYEIPATRPQKRIDERADRRAGGEYGDKGREDHSGGGRYSR